MKMLIVHDGDSDGRTVACLFLQSILLLKMSLDPLMPEFKHGLESLGSRAADTNQLQFYETRSRDTIEWMKHVDKDTIIVILDLTFRQEHFQEMMRVTKSVYVIDHHDGYDFAWMDASCLVGFGKCWFHGDETRSPPGLTTQMRDYFSLHYATNKSTTGLVFTLYQHILSNAAFNINAVQFNRGRMSFKVYVENLRESRVDICMEAPTNDTYYLDPTWVPNKEFVYNVEDFDINHRKIPTSANFDAGLRRLVEETDRNNMWAVYHLLFRENFLHPGVSFLDGGNLISTPEHYRQVNSIAAIGENDFREHMEKLKDQIASGPTFIQTERGENEPNMYSFVMIECSKYQTQVGAAVLESNPGFAYAILHYEEDGYQKLSFRRNFNPRFSSVNLKELTGELGLMICGVPRGGGHPGAAGLRLTLEEFKKFQEFVNRTCPKVVL